MDEDRKSLDASQVLALAERSGSDPRTVLRWCTGERVRPLATKRLEREYAKLQAEQESTEGATR